MSAAGGDFVNSVTLYRWWTEIVDGFEDIGEAQIQCSFVPHLLAQFKVRCDLVPHSLKACQGVPGSDNPG